MSLRLARLHPGLKFVIQDRPAVLKQATAMWRKEYLEALETRVTMMPHDFFDTNPAKGAAVYLLRHIMCVQSTLNREHLLTQNVGTTGTTKTAYEFYRV